MTIHLFLESTQKEKKYRCTYRIGNINKHLVVLKEIAVYHEYEHNLKFKMHNLKLRCRTL